MDKEFKNIDQQVALLQSRGVQTNTQTARILQRDGYYAIVNGYKDPFLDKQAMQKSSSDVYKSDTTFEQIYDLFCFDRDMRSLVLPFLLKTESIAKNAVVYAFCSRHRQLDAYLERTNYVSAQHMLVSESFKGSLATEREKRLNTLLGIFSRKLELSRRTRPFTRHYLEKYGQVPLWVLQNDLTFGNIEHFYQLQERGIQNEVCKIIATVAGHQRHIGARQLLKALSVLVGYRNICAHDDRLYCASVKGYRFKEMLSQMALLLPADELTALGDQIQATGEKYRNKVSPTILETMS